MKPHQPQILLLQGIDWNEFINLLDKANHYIARYDGLLQTIANPDIFSNRDDVLAQMFDINDLWEQYGALQIRKHLPSMSL